MEETSELESTPSRSDTDIDASHGAKASYDVTSSESSFMPTNAVSSTPARATYPHDQTADDQPSWSASLESPLVRLDRELQSFTREEYEASARQDVDSVCDDSVYEEEATVQQDFTLKGKGKELSAPEPRGILKNNFQPTFVSQSAIPTPKAQPRSTHVSPLKVKPKTPIAIPKHLQAYIPPKSRPEPALLSPRRPKYQRSPRKPLLEALASTSTSSSALDIPSLTKHSTEANVDKNFDEFNDSFDDSVDLMHGMSPPRTLAFARAPRSSIGLGLLPPGRTPGKNPFPKLGKTPMREAADRIRRDLLGDVQSSTRSTAAIERSQAYGYGSAVTKDDTMSTIPTPPSLSRYTRHAYPLGTDTNDTDTSLGAMMRRVGLKVPESGSPRGPDMGLLLAPPVSQNELNTPDHHVSDVFRLHQDEQSVIGDSHADSDSDSDSLNDEPAQPGQPSTAFLMASARDPDPDDSFASTSSNRSSDSLGAEEYAAEEVAGAPVHPFARAIAGEGDEFDDSFDSMDGDDGGRFEGEVEETVFGIPPGQRERGAKARGELRMLGEDLLQDTMGIGNQLAKVGRVEESPTPFARS